MISSRLLPHHFCHCKGQLLSVTRSGPLYSVPRLSGAQLARPAAEVQLLSAFAKLYDTLLPGDSHCFALFRSLVQKRGLSDGVHAVLAVQYLINTIALSFGLHSIKWRRRTSTDSTSRYTISLEPNRWNVRCSYRVQLQKHDKQLPALFPPVVCFSCQTRAKSLFWPVKSLGRGQSSFPVLAARPRARVSSIVYRLVAFTTERSTPSMS